MGRASPDLLDPARYAFRYDLQTRFADIDPNRHINNVAMAAAFEDSRVRFDTESGLYAQVGDRRMMIAAAHIDYIAEAHYPAPLTMCVAVLDISRSSWSLAQLAVQEGRARAFCRAVMVSIDRDRPAAITDDLRARLDAGRIRAIRGD